MVVYNEAKNIKRCLESLRGVVSEIILVHDGECADRTLEIAKEHKAKIFIQSHQGEAEPHRSFSFKQAAGDWILQIDGDEFLSSELQNFLRNFNPPEDVNAYKFIWPLWNGQKANSGTWPYKKCLFKKAALSFLGIPHFVAETSGRTQRTNLVLNHQPAYDNLALATFWRKQRPWMKLQASFYLKDFATITKFNYEGKKWSKKYQCRRNWPLLLLPFEFLLTLFKNIGSGAYRAGLAGFKTAWQAATYRAGLNYYLFKLKKTWPAAWIFGGFFILFLGLLWPLGRHLSSAIIGSGDSYVFLWNEWWLKFCLSTGQNPFFTNLLLHPYGANLAFHTLALPASFAGALLSFIWPLTLSFNLVFLSELALAALAMYYLADYLWSNKPAALLAALMFSANIYVFSEISKGHFNYASIYTIPLFIYFLLRALDENSRKFSLLTSLVLALAFYNDYYYTIGLLFLAALFIINFFINQRAKFFAGFNNLLIIFGVWLFLISPLLYTLLVSLNSGAYPLANLNQISLYAPDWRSFFTPPVYQPVYGHYFQEFYASLKWHDGIIYFGVVALALGFYGWLKLKGNRLWTDRRFLLIGFLTFLVLALGPFLYLGRQVFSLAGHDFKIPLPYLLFQFIPFVRGILVPPRLIIFAWFFLALLAAGGLKIIFTRLKGSGVSVLIFLLIASLFIFENLAIPLPLESTEVPAVYKSLKTTPGANTILELPFALSTSFYTLGEVPASSRLEYFQTVHEQKILGGYISRVPDETYNFYSHLLGLSYLINPLAPQPENLKLSAEKIKSNFSRLGLKYVIIHVEYYNHEALLKTVDFMHQLYPNPPLQEDSLLIYKLD